MKFKSTSQRKAVMASLNKNGQGMPTKYNNTMNSKKQSKVVQLGRDSGMPEDKAKVDDEGERIVKEKPIKIGKVAIQDSIDQTDSYSGGYYVNGTVKLDGKDIDFNLSGSDGLQILDDKYSSSISDNDFEKLEKVIDKAVSRRYKK